MRVCGPRKKQFAYGIDPGTSYFFQTLILIGFALRYHSKRREGSGSTAAGGPLPGANCPVGMIRSRSCSTARPAHV
jgi:hypothetical protein